MPDAVIEAFENLMYKPPERWTKYFDNWLYRMECIHCNGEYFEKQ